MSVKFPAQDRESLEPLAWKYGQKRQYAGAVSSMGIAIAAPSPVIALDMPRTRWRAVAARFGSNGVCQTCRSVNSPSLLKKMTQTVRTSNPWAAQPAPYSWAWISYWSPTP